MTDQPPAIPPRPMAPEPQYTPPPKTSGAAIASLILSLVGFCIPFLGPLLAIVFGIVGKVNVGNSQGRLTGGGMAIAGICLGVLGLLGHGVFVGGSIYLASKTVAMIKEIETQMTSVKTAAEKGDWEGVAGELTGPGSVSKEEVIGKFKAAEQKYGKLAGFDLAQMEPIQSEMQKDMFSWPFRLVFNADGDKGPCNMNVNIKRVGSKFQVTSLEFQEGHVNKTIDHHKKRDGD